MTGLLCVIAGALAFLALAVALTLVLMLRRQPPALNDEPDYVIGDCDDRRNLF